MPERPLNMDLVRELLESLNRQLAAHLQTLQERLEQIRAEGLDPEAEAARIDTAHREYFEATDAIRRDHEATKREIEQAPSMPPIDPDKLS